MPKVSTRSKVITAIVGTALAFGGLFSQQSKEPARILNADPNIQYVYTDAEGVRVIGVLDDKTTLKATARSGKYRVEKTTAFIFYGEEPPDNPTYLPFIINYRALDWPANRDRSGRWRPAPGGVSIGHPDITAGTLGGHICYNGNCNCFLSNAHVMGGLNGAQIGDPILQPGPHDGGRLSNGDEIGKIVAIVAPKSGINNSVDAAIACGNETTVYPEIYGIGRVDNVFSNPQIGMTATKCGRTTGCTTLTLAAKDVTVKIGYYIDRKWKSYVFVHQMLWQGVSAGGDSGSMIVTDLLFDSLLFAGNDNEQVMGNDPAYILQTIPGAYLPGMRYQGLAYP
jgi:hypothetical protein